MKRLLIAGIDPGTTLGYALVDLEGNIVKTDNSKQLDMSSLIMEMIKEGKVLIIGTDKGKTPKFIEKTATNLGARIIKPKEDLLVEEKRELTEGYEFRNEHEKDALAAAMYAFKRIRKLLRKVDIYLKNHGKEDINYEVKKIMLKNKGLSIAETIAAIEKPEQEKEERRKRNRTGKTKEEDYYFEEEIKDGNLDELKRKNELLRKNMVKIIKTKMKKIVRIKNQKIDLLTKNIREQEEVIKKLNDKLEKIKDITRKTDKNIILKKLKNLSWDEIEKEELGKVVYVEDPNIFSEKSIEKIKNRVDIIISKKEMSKNVEEKFKAISINANKLDTEEYEDIILINKEELEKEKNKVDIVKKVIEEYKKNRK